MKMKSLSCIFTLVIASSTSAFALDQKPAVMMENNVIWEDASTYLGLKGTNVSDKPLRLDAPGVSDSPIFIGSPDGQELLDVAIVEWIKLPEPQKPGFTVESQFLPLKELNSIGLYQTGIYHVFWKTTTADNSFLSKEILLYREESAPKISSGSDLSIDDPSIVLQSMQDRIYPDIQRRYRETQLAASEGTKQFLFAHPFTLALCLDDESGIKLDLLATNTNSNLLPISPLGADSNYLEVHTPMLGQVLRFPPFQQYEEKKTLVGGETKKWTVNVSRFLQEHDDYLKAGGLKAIQPGQYQAIWMFGGKKVAEFAFTRH